MKKLLLVLTALLICGMLGGCVAPTMYYYDGYSSALYAYKKSPDAKTLLNYKKSLEDIIEKSPKKKLRVPPGIYCEYAYLLAKEGNSTEALKFFALEKSTYPESAFFVDKLMAKLSSKGIAPGSTSPQIDKTISPPSKIDTSAIRKE